MRRVASTGLLVLVLVVAGCGVPDQPVAPKDGVASNAETVKPHWTPPAVVETPEFEFTRRDACDPEDLRLPVNAMTMARKSGLLELDVDAAVYCSSVAAYPEVSFLRDLVTVSVMDYSLTTDGTAAACMCTNALHFKFKRDVPKGTRIVFLIDGKAESDGQAP